jgi:hypothetical protein
MLARLSGGGVGVGLGVGVPRAVAAAASAPTGLAPVAALGPEAQAASSGSIAKVTGPNRFKPA